MVPPKKKGMVPQKSEGHSRMKNIKRPCITSKSNSFPINKNQPKGNITV